MFINRKQIQNYFKDHNKSIGKDSLDSLDVKVKLFLDKLISSTKSFRSIKKEDVDNFTIKMNF